MESEAETESLAFIVLGSNIEPERNLPLALERLRRSLEVVAVSSVYRTLPVGREDVPVFLNAAVAVRTDRDPADLKFNVLRSIEADLGRVRGADRNAPRTIDLDLVLYGDRTVSQPDQGLELPDPEIALRAHIGFPLAEIAPDLIVPDQGKSLHEIAAGLETPAGMSRIDLSGWRR